MPFYAVLEGKERGVFLTWAECQQQVSGFRNAKFKKFDTKEDAERYVRGGQQMDEVSETLKSARCTSVFKSKVLHQKHVLNQYKKSGRRTQLIDSLQEDNNSTAIYSRFPAAPVVYTDGACLGNGTSNAVGGIGVYWAPSHPRNISENLQDELPTNQKAELTAAIRAVQDAISMDLQAVELRTDSIYTIKAMTEWIQHWKNGGQWKNAQGEPVCNMDKIKQLDGLCSQIKVTWVHVPAHSGIYGNEQADAFARQGALKGCSLCTTSG